MAVTILVIEYLISSRIYISISPLKLWWDSNGALSFVIKQNMLWKQTMIFLSMFHYSIRLWNTPKKNLLLISTVRSKSYNTRVWVVICLPIYGCYTTYLIPYNSGCIKNGAKTAPQPIPAQGQMNLPNSMMVNAGHPEFTAGAGYVFIFKITNMKK